MVKSFPVHLSIVHISFVRAGNSVVVGEERGVGGGIGPSSDSVITRTDYYLTVAGLRAQWRRPARSVTRVSPEKLLGHVRGNDLRAGARGFSWRYYVYTRIHTHARGARDSNANFDRDRGDTSAPRGSCFVTDASCKSYIVSPSPSSPPPRICRACACAPPPFFSLAWVKGPFFRTPGCYTATTRWQRELNSRSFESLEDGRVKFFRILF